MSGSAWLQVLGGSQALLDARSPGSRPVYTLKAYDNGLPLLSHCACHDRWYSRWRGCRPGRGVTRAAVTAGSLQPRAVDPLHIACPPLATPLGMARPGLGWGA